MESSQADLSQSQPLPFAARLGWWTSIALTICTVGTFAVGIATPPRSGPFCLQDCIAYPYTDAAAFFPRDYLWIYPALLLMPLFLVLMTCIQPISDQSRRVASRTGLVFAAIAATIISIDYFVQLESIAPSLIKGEMNGVALFTQYNPHGLFIALEDLGYLILTVAFLFAGIALGRDTRLERVLRWIFMSSFLLALVCYLGMSWHFGPNLEYRFEITVITIDWLTLAVAGILLSVLFRRAMPKGLS